VTIPLNRVRQIIREELETSSSEPFLPDDIVTVTSKTVGYPKGDGNLVRVQPNQELTVTKEIAPTPHGNMVAVVTKNGFEFYINPADLARKQ
jgi:hypothetical protein